MIDKNCNHERAVLEWGKHFQHVPWERPFWCTDVQM